MKTFPIERLRKDDACRFVADGPEYTLRHVGRHPDIPGMAEVRIAGVEQPLAIPVNAPVYATRVVRTVGVPCLLCRDDFPWTVNLAEDAVPSLGICGPCDLKTTAEVLRSAAEKGMV